MEYTVAMTKAYSKEFSSSFGANSALPLLPRMDRKKTFCLLTDILLQCLIVKKKKKEKIDKTRNTVFSKKSKEVELFNT